MFGFRLGPKWGVGLWLVLVSVPADACRVVCSLESEIFILCGIGSDTHFQLLRDGKLFVDHLACEFPTYPAGSTPPEQEELRLINHCTNSEGATVRMQRRQVRALGLTEEGPQPVDSDELVLRVELPEQAPEAFVFDRKECGSAAER